MAMRALRVIGAILGTLIVLMGLLWIGQGLGIVMWPAESFMLAERKWAVNGALLALAGGALIWFARRR